MTANKSVFSKSALIPDEQVNLLIDRNLKIGDESFARHCLRFIGYYRLSAYFVPFQYGETGPNRHQFKLGASFEEIINLYIFDRKLRLLVMDAIERIEVAVKAVISDIASVSYGSHWYTNQEYFVDAEKHLKFIDRLREDISRNNSDTFIRHYRSTYSQPELPPSWMVFETLSLGTVSALYKNMCTGLRKSVAANFSIPHVVFESWLHSLSHVRNLCAHHSRLWNRIFTIKPKTKILNKERGDVIDNSKLFAQILIIAKLLGIVSPDSCWNVQLKKLLQDYPSVNTSAMGFPNNWKLILS